MLGKINTLKYLSITQTLHVQKTTELGYWRVGVFQQLRLFQEENMGREKRVFINYIYEQIESFLICTGKELSC